MPHNIFVEVLDPRNFPQHNKKSWRETLKLELSNRRQWRSDLSGRYLMGSEMHEGLYSRRVVPKNVSWQYMIFHEYNCFLLSPEEHRPQPPSRTLCYWLSVARYTKDKVDEWIDSLPWKVPPDRPWRGTHGAEVIQALIDTQFIHKPRLDFLMSPAVIKQIDQEG